MTSIEELPPDQRAALSLLLRQRRRYDDLAATLGIAPTALHDRAHAALAVLAPRQARELDAKTREQIGEYLLSQQSARQAKATQAKLASSSTAQEWARSLAAALADLAADALPEIPEPAPESAPASVVPASAASATAKGLASAASEGPASAAPGTESSPADASPRSAAVSRRGGAILLAVLAAAAIAVVVIALSSGGGSGSGQQAAARRSPSGGGKAAAKSHGSSAKAVVEKTATLTATAHGGAAKGGAEIGTKEGSHAIVVEATGLAPTHGFSYVVWLLDSKGEAVPLGSTPPVTSSGTLAAGLGLPVPGSVISAITGIEVTRETARHPTTPGTVVLKGRFVSG